MARYVRQHNPDIKIILGGHGASLGGLRDMVECDEVCYGEGVSWLRNYFGENPGDPIIHPVVQTAVKSSVYGVPLTKKGGAIIPGVGCQNGCRFCSTTHKFEKKYTAFLKTGRDIFNACLKDEEELGVDDFGLMDENFCKNEIPARQLLVEMEKEKKTYTFTTFSSAEAVTKIGVDALVRMGVTLLWIGVESKANIFEKTKGIDLHALIADLQNHGVTVLASTILFLEHHDKQTICEDIDWSIGLQSDLLQFMQFGPLPGTPLFDDYASQGKLIDDFPYHKRHGQGFIWFRHPHFTQAESFEYLKNAFIKKYHTHGPGVLSMAHTALKGYLTIKKEIEYLEAEKLTWDPRTLRYTKQNEYKPDDYLALRLKAMRENAIKYRPVLRTTMNYAPNEQSARKSRMVIELFNETFGPPSSLDNLMDLAVRIKAFWENRYFLKNGIKMRQPQTLRVTYKNRLKEEPSLAGFACKDLKQAILTDIVR
jgi:hypothetical protein